MSTPGFHVTPGHVATEIPGRGGIIAPGAPTCHRCGTTATTQWRQHVTTDEAEAHWTAVEQNIRASNDGQAETAYTADRTDTVVKAVFGCDQHDLSPEPTNNHDSSDEANARAAAAAKQAGAKARTLIHNVDCGGHGACQCKETNA